MHKIVHISKGKYALSKRGQRFIFVLCLLFILILAFLDKSYFNYSFQSWHENKTQSASSDIEKYHANTFTVTNVVDGDTLDINCPDNQNIYTRIRLLGIDTPEMNTESGEMYFAREASVFAQKSALGKQVTIYLDEISDTRDKYDRLLAYVLLPDSVFLNETLLSEGYAYAYTRYKHSFYNKYNQLESRARSNKKGLWLNVKPEQFPQWFQDSKKNNKISR
ncbi:MAG: thermonuclease family protein [Sedimentisphaerales bacterium]|nr:thermonuclease family protein [Sedimentisphaerales bacterium]